MCVSGVPIPFELPTSDLGPGKLYLNMGFCPKYPFHRGPHFNTSIAMLESLTRMDSIITLLCGLEQVPSPFWASVSLTDKE